MNRKYHNHWQSENLENIEIINKRKCTQAIRQQEVIHAQLITVSGRSIFDHKETSGILISEAKNLFVRNAEEKHSVDLF